jgi:glycosyltransferase involved in cell wall biosynthesis
MDRPHAFKGVGFLLDAWGRLGLAGTKLVLVGQGELRPSYLDRATALGLSKSVVFSGPVEDEDLPRLYTLADLLVLPSLDRSEAFGLVLLEAMASGRPVIASALPGVRSVFEDGKEGFLFPAGDENAFLAKLRLLLGDDGLRARMGAAGRGRAVSTYAQEVVWRRLERVFLEVLG